MNLSVAYYPEHWDRNEWEKDIHLMADAGISMVRVGEFAWSLLEKESGKFCFSWLDEVIGLLDKYGIKMILCTPTASPPPWLVEEHPDILLMHANRTKRIVGSRRHYCYNNKNFHEHTVDVVRAMAKRYHDCPTVFAWHIDNEFAQEGTGKCYCDICKEKFQNWLKVHYKTLDELNEKWGNIFWSQVYTKWTQIELPISTFDGIAELQPDFRNNPSHLLSFQRFTSDSYTSYLQLQIDTLHEGKVSSPITTNFAEFSANEIDYYSMAKNLDVVSNDCYPDPTIPDYSRQAFVYDHSRGIKDDKFWLMETTTGSMGICWGRQNGPKPHPGSLYVLAYQALARGAELINYFRWRTCRFGAEQHEMGILDHDGVPRRRYEEIKKIGREWDKLRKELNIVPQKNEVAICFSYDHLWSSKISPINPQFTYLTHLSQYHRILQQMHIGVDVIPYNRDFSGYRVIFAPFCCMVDDELVTRFTEYVNGGGTLVVTLETGMKNFEGVITDEILPGKLRALMGAEVEHFEGLPNNEELTVSLNNVGAREIRSPALIWRDLLNTVEAKPVAIYENGYSKGKPAITRNAYGKGYAYYFGTICDDEFTREFIKQIINEKGVESFISTEEEGLETVKRGEYLFILNHSQRDKMICLTRTYEDVLTHKKLEKEVELKSKEVMVLKEA